MVPADVGLAPRNRSVKHCKPRRCQPRLTQPPDAAIPSERRGRPDDHDAADRVVGVGFFDGVAHLARHFRFITLSFSGRFKVTMPTPSSLSTAGTGHSRRPRLCPFGGIVLQSRFGAVFAGRTFHEGLGSSRDGTASSRSTLSVRPPPPRDHLQFRCWHPGND